MADLQHRIVIRREAFGHGFDVLIEPHVEGISREGPDHKSAFGYASGLRLTHRWPIIDETKEADHG